MHRAAVNMECSGPAGTSSAHQDDKTESSNNKKDMKKNKTKDKRRSAISVAKKKLTKNYCDDMSDGRKDQGVTPSNESISVKDEAVAEKHANLIDCSNTAMARNATDLDGSRAGDNVHSTDADLKMRTVGETESNKNSNQKETRNADVSYKCHDKINDGNDNVSNKCDDKTSNGNDDKNNEGSNRSAYDSDTEEEILPAAEKTDNSPNEKVQTGKIESEKSDTEMEITPDKQNEDDDATDVECYDKSYKVATRKEPETSLKKKKPVTVMKRNEDHVCPVCFDDFNLLDDFYQHLSANDCQPEPMDYDSFECSFCALSFSDIVEFKTHYLSHLKGGSKAFSCMACEMTFCTSQALDQHMFVNASILNKLRSSKEVVALPDLLCKTVVDILAESANISVGAGNAEKRLETSDEEEEEEDEKEGGKPVKKIRRDYSDDEMEEEDHEDEDGDDDIADDCDESNLPSEIEQDLEDAENDEEEISKIPRPFLTSSLTDDPMTPYGDFDNEDSLTSQSLNSAEDAFSLSSRRKSKHPLQVQRNSEAGKMDESVIKIEDDEETLKGRELMDPVPLMCSMCGDKLADRKKLDLHISEHEKLFPFFCSLCHANFMEGKLLRMHVACCHSASQSLQCQMCGMYFKLRGSLATHMKFCRQAPACVVCGENFKTGPELEKHYFSHSLEERASAEFLSCSDCGEVFVSTLQLREHQKSHGATRPFSCEVCGGNFSQKKILDKHREVHFRQQDCKCEICGVQLLTRSGYKAHLRGHKNNETLQVGPDGKLTTVLQEKPKKVEKKAGEKVEGEENQGLTLDTAEYLKLIDDQMSSVDSDSCEKSRKNNNYSKTKVHSCPFCDLTFTSADRFQAHIRRLHKDQAHFDECDVCHRKIYGKEYLQKHRRTHANFTEQYPCDQCSKVFRRKWSLETHRKIHTFRKFVQCDICGEEFRFVSEVDKHKHKVHQYDRTRASYECNVCKMKFATLSHLSIHSSHSHKPTDGKPFKCATCLSVFATCVELKKHIYCTHQSGPNSGQAVKREPLDTYEGSKANGDDKDDPLYGQVKSYVKKFVRGLSFENNKGTDLQDDDVEEKSGVDAYNELTRQKMSQSNLAKRFVCETCEKCFSTKSDLRTHIRTHTGETPYKCEYCDRAFKQRGHRKLHIQVTHTKDMPYTCDLCGQSYPTRYRYQIHLKRHTGIKEHKCQYCDKAYYTVGKLNEHKRKHHKEEFAEELAEKGTG